GRSIAAATLRPGEHRLTARVADPSGAGAEAQTTVIVDAAPVVAIAAPASGAVFFTTAGPVRLEASATDAEDGDLGAGVRWTSSLDGALGTGGTIDATLGVGTHTITASVSDQHGVTRQ